MLKMHQVIVEPEGLTGSKGFSLIEMAVVMLILGLLLSGLFVALGDSSSNRRRSDANAQIESIIEALYGFAQSNGRLPCPATVASTGAEAFVSVGNCSASDGFVPAVTLSIQGPTDANNLLVDPWGNPYRYSVFGNLYTNVANIKTQFSGTVTSGLCVARAVSCGAPILTTTAPALVYSMGADYAFSSSALQNENADAPINNYRMADDTHFVLADYAEEGANAFDDIVVWISPNTLFSRMISAGQLP